MCFAGASQVLRVRAREEAAAAAAARLVICPNVVGNEFRPKSETGSMCDGQREAEMSWIAEAARRAAEEEAARRVAEQEAARKAAEEVASRKAAEDWIARVRSCCNPCFSFRWTWRIEGNVVRKGHDCCWG